MLYLNCDSERWWRWWDGVECVSQSNRERKLNYYFPKKYYTQNIVYANKQNK